MVPVVFQGELDYAAVRKYAASFDGLPSQDITIDLNQVTFARPCGLASLAAWMERLLQQKRNVSISADASKCFSYMQNMNLFRIFNVYEAENFNRHPQEGRFARMMRIDYETDTTDVARKLKDSLQIAEHAVSGELFTCLEESITNLWAHAGGSGFAVTQSYNRGKPDCWYEIAIVDCGRGIRQALLENPDYQNKIPGDVAAIQMACERGVSGALYRYPTYAQQHFGMGLYHIDQVTVKAGGGFRLCSGSATRHRQADAIKFSPTPTWQGTMLLLKLSHQGLTSPTTNQPGTGVLRFG